MGAIIRAFETADLPILNAICLKTGASGQDATDLYKDPNLLGNIYAAPYASLTPDLVFVVVDEEGVAGYVVGALDSDLWRDRLEREWWPGLREANPLALADDTSLPEADRNGIRALYSPQVIPADVVARFPAHVHMNLLPRLQGQGMGRRLLETWFEAAKNKGARSVHMGVSRNNPGGEAFWKKQGFVPVELANPDPGAIWMGQDLT